MDVNPIRKSVRRKSSQQVKPKLEPASRVVEDYLKTIYSATEWGAAGKQSLSVSKLAQEMGVAPSTASENVRRLTQNGLLVHEPYRGITLTEAGTKIALNMIRKHRLLETYLYEKLDFSWDEVHEEAEILEHAVSNRLIDHIEAALGFPQSDPHGDPIPTRDGQYRQPSSQLLAEAELGQTLTVVRISDDSPQLLRFLKNAGIAPGVQLKPLNYTPQAGVMTAEVAGKTVALGQPAIEVIWVASE